MPILTIIWSFVLSAIPFIVTYVVRGLGFGLVVFAGMTLAIDQVESYIMGRFNNLGTDLYQIMSMMGIPMGIAILFSAYAMLIGIKSTISSAKPVWRSGGGK